MVSGNTANEYGDYFIAHLTSPLENTKTISEWKIVAGLKTVYTTGTISTERNSTIVKGTATQFLEVFSQGDIIIIGNVEYEVLQVIDNMSLELTEALTFEVSNVDYYLLPNDTNEFEYEFRWSHTGGTFTEFHSLNNGSNSGDLKTIQFDPTKPLWIDTKLEVAHISSNNSLSLLSIEYTQITEAGEVVSCPNVCFDDEECDSFEYNGCANIRVECVDGQLFNPYALGKTGNLYKQLVTLTSDIFGHDVQYFRTEPDLRTSDVILMEYSLHNVVAQDTLKVVVPDNEFPSEANTYDIFGIEFAEFEVHITAQEFEKVFGSGKIPRNKDYMYIPIIGRMYEINSLSIADEFNKEKSYWRIKLVKYQERTSVFKNEFEDITDSLTTGVEEIFGEEIQNEYDKTTKPDQFQTVSTSYRDGIREFVHKDMSIVDSDLKNRWTVVSKNYYDLSIAKPGDIVLGYNKDSNLTTDQNIAFTGWFKPQFESSDTNEYFLFGDSAAMSGFKVFLSNSDLILDINNTQRNMQHGITLDSNKWYSYVINISNEFAFTSVYIYSLDPQSNVLSQTSSLPQSGNNNLRLEFENISNNNSLITWNDSVKYVLKANKMFMTNIRVFNTPIELEQHSNVLNQYVVRDNQLALIIDNAIPSLGFQKFANAK